MRTLIVVLAVTVLAIPAHAKRTSGGPMSLSGSPETPEVQLGDTRLQLIPTNWEVHCPELANDKLTTVMLMEVLTKQSDATRIPSAW
jgi:hypothetical protein